MVKYRLRLLLEDHREDGEKPEYLTTCFRHELRASLLIAMIQGTVAILNAAGLPKKFKPKALTIVPPTPSRLAPSSTAQESWEDGEIDASDDSGSDNDSDGGSTPNEDSGSDNDSDGGSTPNSGSDAGCFGHAPSVTPRHSARIAQLSANGPQRPASPTQLASTHFSVDMLGGFPVVG